MPAEPKDAKKLNGSNNDEKRRIQISNLSNQSSSSFAICFVFKDDAMNTLTYCCDRDAEATPIKIDECENPFEIALLIEYMMCEE